MSTLTKTFGTRAYEFESHEDLEKARELWGSCGNSQDDFELELEEQGLDFSIREDN